MWSFKQWFLERLGEGASKVSSKDITWEEMFSVTSEIYVRELAFWQAVNLIANAISKCEFRTFIRGQPVKGGEYYLWNISPNKNQNSSVFLQSLVSHLFKDNEVLVVEFAEQRLIADSFNRKEYALYDDIFSDVTVGDFTFSRSFSQSEVLYLQLHNKNIRPLLNGLYESYRNLIAYGMKSYQRSRGMKGTLAVDTALLSNSDTRARYEEIKNNGFRTFAEAENALLLLTKGMTYTDIGSKTYSNDSSRDIRAMIDDIFDFTARGFGIPPSLLSGNIQGVSDALDQFLTFCIDPLCDMISEEINRKIYGEEVLQGNYLQIDTKCVKHFDLLSVSSAIDKLISSGVFCVNDILKIIGEPEIDEDWAKQHFITKNYSPVDEALKEVEI